MPIMFQNPSGSPVTAMHPPRALGARLTGSVRWSIAIAACLCTLSASRTPAQTNAFTYQGELMQSGSVASGTYDMRFLVFNALAGGTQSGPTACLDNVQVVNGKFTALIDVGQQFATGETRYLEIEVRQDTGADCASVGGFTTLAPRQLISATPVAAHANSAFALDAPDGFPLDAVKVSNDGKVGIGTTTPTHTLHIATAEPTIALQDTDSTGDAGGTQVGYVSYRDNGNSERGWIGYGSPGDPDLSIANARPGGDIVLNSFSGNVGVGTASPVAKLDVRGDIRLGTSAEFYPVKSSANDRIIRGQVNANGTIDASRSSGGFTVSHTVTGTYVIYFNTPFASPPVVTTSSMAICCYCYLSQTQTTFATIFKKTYAGDVNTDSPFQFIAMGQ